MVVLLIATVNWWNHLHAPGLVAPMMWMAKQSSTMKELLFFFWRIRYKHSLYSTVFMSFHYSTNSLMMIESILMNSSSSLFKTYGFIMISFNNASFGNSKQ